MSSLDLRITVRVRFLQRSFTKFWTLARAAARRLVARVDVSCDEIIRLVADDISVDVISSIYSILIIIKIKIPFVI